MEVALVGILVAETWDIQEDLDQVDLEETQGTETRVILVVLELVEDLETKETVDIFPIMVITRAFSIQVLEELHGSPHNTVQKEEVQNSPLCP